MNNAILLLCRSLHVLLAFVGSMLQTASSHAQNIPDPLRLLQGVESVRLQVPPSSLTLRIFYQDSLVTNETIISVDFNGDLRGFNAISESVNERNYQTVFDGERAICYNEGLRQVTYRGLNDQLPMKLFDPRVIGISTYNHWADRTANTLPYGYSNSKVEMVGRENVGNLSAWHVRLSLIAKDGNSVSDFWIDETQGFRVYRTDFNGVQTFSFYENDNYPWLPTRVLGKEYSHSPNGDVALVAERGLEILKAKANVKFPKSRWTLAGMSIKPGTDVVDFYLSRGIGTWDGKRLTQELDIPQRSKPWYYVCFVILIAAPVFYLWSANRRNSKSVIS